MTGPMSDRELDKLAKKRDSDRERNTMESIAKNESSPPGFHSARPTPQASVKSEDRETFSVPTGCVPVLDADRRATGGFVVKALADRLDGYTPIFKDGEVVSVILEKDIMAKLESQLNLDIGMDVPGYEPLRRVLETAYNQSARGKGRERHANEKPFMDQPIMSIARMVGVGGHTYQISKKAQEASTMVARGQHAAAKAELLGVIIYAAAAYLLVEES